MPAPPPTGNHFIVCGDNSLAYRITLELTSRYGQQVTVILPSRAHNYGPQISALTGVTVLERAAATSEAFIDAGVQSARALALVWQDDVGNFHAALRAKDLNPGLRLVLAIFSQRLIEHIPDFVRDCAVLSGTAMAAPAFVAAAVGQPDPSHVQVAERTLYVGRREDVLPGQVVCGLEVPDDPAGATRLLPPEALAAADGAPRLVLAVATGAPRDPRARRRHPVQAVTGVARRLAWNKFGVVFAVLVAVMIAGYVLLHFARHPWPGSAYLAVMSLTGSALTNASLLFPEKLSQVILTIDGMALIPVVTALIVSAQVSGSIRGEPRPHGSHVIVIGLGNVGTQVVSDLHDLGFDVACVELNPEARGVALARRLRLPLVLADATREETLRAAGIDTCSALVSVASNDIVNLETAMQARALREDVRLVLRLGDDDLAQRVQEKFRNAVSRSVSYLAAPPFAAALLERQVLRTIDVGRHVLLIADVTVEPGTGIAGQPIVELERDRLARVLALHVRGTHGFDWSPHRGYLLAPGDRVIVVATRAGLRGFVGGSRPVSPSQ